MNVPIVAVIAFNAVVALPVAAFWVISARKGPPTGFHLGVVTLALGLIGVADAIMLSSDTFLAAVFGLMGAPLVLIGAKKLFVWKRDDEIRQR